MPRQRQPQPNASRRHVLRAAGVSLFLPLLDSFKGTHLAAAEPTAQPPASPARMIFIFNPLGPSNIHWHPKGTGANYTMSDTLKPLEGLRKDLTVLSGPTHIATPSGAGHEMVARLLTGFTPEDTTHKPVKRASIDQIAAAHLGQDTRYPSLQISTDEGAGPVVRSRTMSFNPAGRALPSIQDPRQLFRRLFVPETAKSKAQAEQRFKDRTSLLDEVLDQLSGIDKKLGQADRHRLSQFQESIREVEKQLERDFEWSSVKKPEISADNLEFEIDSRTAWISVMNDIMCLALQTNSTRVISALYGIEGDSYNWREAKVGTGHHGLQHHGGDEKKLAKLAMVDQAKINTLHRLCKKLKEINTPEGSLFDQTMIWYGHGLNNGGPGYVKGKGVHYTRDLSHLVLGGKSLGLQHGQHLVYDSKKVPLNNLWLTFLHSAGIKQDKLVDSTGLITDMLRS